MGCRYLKLIAQLRMLMLKLILAMVVQKNIVTLSFAPLFNFCTLIPEFFLLFHAHS